MCFQPFTSCICHLWNLLYDGWLYCHNFFWSLTPMLLYEETHYYVKFILRGVLLVYCHLRFTVSFLFSHLVYSLNCKLYYQEATPAWKLMLHHADVMFCPKRTILLSIILGNMGVCCIMCNWTLQELLTLQSVVTSNQK